MTAAKLGKRPLPNELLYEMVSAMPAGIICLGGDFTRRMERHLSAFIWPRFWKFQSKRNNAMLCLELQQKRISVKIEELDKERKILLSRMKAQQKLPFDQAKSDEFDRRQAALEQQKAQLTGQREGFKREFAAYRSALKRSKLFAKELVGDKAGQCISSSGDDDDDDDGTVCEANSRKRKKRRI